MSKTTITRIVFLVFSIVFISTVTMAWGISKSTEDDIIPPAIETEVEEPVVQPEPEPEREPEAMGAKSKTYMDYRAITN